jgi:ubiquinone/menaquinone biosynthesis C-methylase UbiE
MKRVQMTNEAAQFVGSIPDNYDRGLGPHIFVDFAADLARRVASASPSRVLELAAGTGIVTRALREALPASIHLLATDLNPPMLEVAQKKFNVDENIAFQPADATALPFEDVAFDAIACQFGVMFFPDKDKSYREAYRVLSPGGRYLFNVWDAFEYNPFARIAHETIGRFLPADVPGFYRVPFGYHQIDPIKASLLVTGFGEVSASVVRFQKIIPSAVEFAKGLVFGNPVIEQIRDRGTADPDGVVAAVTTALQEAFGADPGLMPLQAIVFSARKPQ